MTRLSRPGRLNGNRRGYVCSIEPDAWKAPHRCARAEARRRAVGPTQGCDEVRLEYAHDQGMVCRSLGDLSYHKFGLIGKAVGLSDGVLLALIGLTIRRELFVVESSIHSLPTNTDLRFKAFSDRTSRMRGHTKLA
jgi:hypothetical protein